MTSTPASRRARATTFAPRSWPSKPGFAITTRMLLMTYLPTRRARAGPARAGAQLPCWQRNRPRGETDTAMLDESPGHGRMRRNFTAELFVPVAGGRCGRTTPALQRAGHPGADHRDHGRAGTGNGAEGARTSYSFSIGA